MIYQQIDISFIFISARKIFLSIARTRCRKRFSLRLRMKHVRFGALIIVAGSSKYEMFVYIMVFYLHAKFGGRSIPI